MFAPKSFKVSLQALLAITLLTPAAFAQSTADTSLIAQNKYVQTYSFGKKTQQIKSRNAEKAKKKAAKEGDKKDKETGNTKSGTKAKTASKKKKSKTKMIVGPVQYTIKSGKSWEKFSGFIKIKPGVETLPLKFTILNGSGTQPLRAIRATLSGRQLFTEKDFKGKQKLSIDLSGALTPGSTQIIFTAYGAKNSSFKWQITTNASATITALKPSKAQKSKPVTAEGKNLPTETSAIKVSVEDKWAKISKPTTTSFKFDIPKKVKIGKDKKVVIYILGKKVKQFKIEIQGTPKIIRFSHVGIGGLQAFSILGENFSKDAKDMEVTFNGLRGKILGTNGKQINVETPDFSRIPSVQDVNVKVNGVDCEKKGKVLGNMRNIPNTENYSPFEVPAHLL